jgi:hypothetical protein
MPNFTTALHIGEDGGADSSSIAKNSNQLRPVVIVHKKNDDTKLLNRMSRISPIMVFDSAQILQFYNGTSIYENCS